MTNINDIQIEENVQKSIDRVIDMFMLKKAVISDNSSDLTSAERKILTDDFNAEMDNLKKDVLMAQYISRKESSLFDKTVLKVKIQIEKNKALKEKKKKSMAGRNVVPIDSVFNALPPKSKIINNYIKKSDIRMMYLEGYSNKDVLLEIFNVIIDNFNNKKYDVDDYMEIRNTLSKIEKYHLLKFKDEIITLLKLDCSEIYEVAGKLKKNKNIRQYRGNDSSTYISVLKAIVELIHDWQFIIRDIIKPSSLINKTFAEQLDFYNSINEDIRLNGIGKYNDMIANKFMEKYEDLVDCEIINKIILKQMKTSGILFINILDDEMAKIKYKIKNKNGEGILEYKIEKNTKYKKKIGN